jgi:regulatory protein
VERPPPSKSKAKSPPSLAARALSLLARREHSRAELARKLAAHGADAAELDALLDDLGRRGWLSDARYAEQYVHAKSGRYGPARLRHALLARGVARATVELAVRALAPDQLAAARKVLASRFRAPPADAAERARRVRFLQSRGFSLDVALRAVRGDDSADGDEHA